MPVFDRLKSLPLILSLICSGSLHAKFGFDTQQGFIPRNKVISEECNTEVDIPIPLVDGLVFELDEQTGRQLL